MRLIVAGSRNLNKFQALFLFLVWWKEQHFDNKVELVTGCCPSGPDQIPFMLEAISDVPYKIKKFPAEWDTYGASAGPIRNKQMAEYADALVLIWDGKSRGSQSMKRFMKQTDKPVYEILVYEGKDI